ncbi:MAG: diguanylate cyclase [Candidatus Competibacteraceae bacterium]|nr:diguanylate cyclase [Candidatus Competibacteraceae bacterium]
MILKRPRTLPLRQKMMALNLFGGAITLLVTFALFSFVYFYSAQQRVTANAMATARLLAQNITPMLVFGDREAARALLATLDQQTDILSATVYGAEGHVFATWAHPRQPAGTVAVSAAPLTTFGAMLESGQLEIVVPMLQEGERVGAFQLRESLQSISQEIRQFVLIGLALTLIASALAAILLHRLQLRALAPVFELSNLAERVATQYDYRLRARVQADDELGRLARCFNEMLERIEARESALTAEIGERRAAERKLDRLAHYDSLTQLPNRYLFQKEIQRVIGGAVADGHLTALLFIDLDNFKLVNDTAGHDAGDLLLKVVAKRLSAVLRDSDRLYRLGGDEFAAILPQLGSIAQAEALAERIIATLASPMLICGMEMRVGASIGIAQCAIQSVEPALLLRQADIAMYAAKQAGKNAYRVYDRSMVAAAQARLDPPALADAD